MSVSNRTGVVLLCGGAVGLVVLCVFLGTSTDRESNILGASAATAEQPRSDLSSSDQASASTRAELPPGNEAIAAHSTAANAKAFEDQASDPVDKVDPAGVSNKQRLAYLLNSHTFMLKICTASWMSDQQKALSELGLVERCVAAILHANGRAEFASPEEMERGFHLGTTTEHEIVFAMDCALYRVGRGEFPALDTAHDRVSELNQGGTLGNRPIDYDGQIEDLYERALASLGVPGRTQTARQDK